MISIRYVLLRILILLIVFYPFIGFTFITFLGIGIENTLALLLISMAPVFLFESNRISQKIIFPKYLLFFFLFILFQFFSNLYILQKPITIKYLIANRFIPVFFFFLIIENTPSISTRLNKVLMNILFVIIIISFFVILFQYQNPTFFVNPSHFQTDVNYKLDTSTIRLQSIYSWSGYIAMGFCSISFAAILLSYYFKSGRNLPIIIILFLTAIIVLLGKSRWVMVNYLLLLIMFVIYKKISALNFIRFLLIIIAVISSFYILKFLQINIENIVNERILEKSRGGLTEGSASTRIFAFELFFRLFPEHPFFGVGQEINQELDTLLGGRSSQIHVGYLSLFYYYGIIGGCIYVLFLYNLTKRLYDHAVFHHFWGSFFGWLGFLFANLTLVYLCPWDVSLMLCVILDRYYLQNKITKAFAIE